MCCPMRARTPQVALCVAFLTEHDGRCLWRPILLQHSHPDVIASQDSCELWRLIADYRCAEISQVLSELLTLDVKVSRGRY